MIRIIQTSEEEDVQAAAALIRAFVAWQRETYHDYLDIVDKYFAHIEVETDNLPGPYLPPQGRLLLASVDGVPAGVCALKPLGSADCEMKRMFVYPRFQGQGVGKALALRLIAEARLAGYQRMLLETGPRQLAAAGLYRSLGFEPIAPYYEIPPEYAEEFTERALFMALAL
jgi:GNAT superfamily N-acetyltransferase